MMFSCEKPLPAPPAPPKHRNSSIAATLPTYRSRPTPGASAASSSFNATRAMFNVIGKSDVLPTILKASQNPAVRSTAVSVARNENVQAAVMKSASKENARMTIAEMARRYDTQAAKNASSSYSYNATGAEPIENFHSTGCMETNSQRQLSSTALPSNTSSLYPNLGNVFNSGNCSVNQPLVNTKSNVNDAPKSQQSHSMNFQAIRDSLDALGLFGNANKKAAPARPPPPKIKSNRCSSAPSTSPTNEPHAIVRYPYKSAHVDELTCMPDDVVILKKEVDDQWIYALNTRTGEIGIVPIVFLNIKVPLAPTQQNNFVKASVSSSYGEETYVKALYDYNSGVVGDLQFFAGDRIRVTGKVNNDWLRGVSGIQEGIFPANFVEFISGSGGDLCSLSETTKNLGPLDTTALQNNSPISNFNISTSTASPETVTANYSYNSGIADDLIFEAGDVIEVLEWVNSDWLRGRLNGYTGLVPSTYITRNS